MHVADLKPNYALRASIERWLTTHTPAPPTPCTPSPLPIQKGFEVSKRESDTHITLTLRPTHTETMDTICIAVLDVSGSMSSGVQSRGQTTEEGPEFSRLDLVKHSMNTLVELMAAEYPNTKSSLGIVSFSDAARIVMPVMPMVDMGLIHAKASIDLLTASGGTNIWDGLRLALEQASNQNPAANIQILLLTDGEPSPGLLPILGIEKTLQKKLASIPVRTTIHTFGFGYRLDSNLMEKICMLGGGSYGFIPDCSMVGTVFINWCAKALLTLAHHVTVKVGETEFQVGDCILGMPRTLTFPKSADSIPSVSVNYDNGQTETCTVTSSTESMDHEDWLTKLTIAVKQVKNAPSYIVAKAVADDSFQSLYDELDMIPDKDKFLVDIQRDLKSSDDNEGQLTKSVANEKWFDTWGKNHLIAYSRALELEQCINFKDKVLQHFAGQVFQAIQEKGIDIFSNMSPPTPSIYNRVHTWSMGSTTIPNIDTQVDMGAFVMASGGCFSGSNVVLMDDGRPKYVKDLKRGDKVWGGHTIRVVVYTALEEPVQMVKFATGLLITPWHPIRNSPVEPWLHPAEMVKGVQGTASIPGYYNLVLDSGHVVEINGYQVCTLGHGFTESAVIRHPYFGTEAVIEDLKVRDGWAEGFVQLSLANIQRNLSTGLVEKV
jgi:Mg-chelatase subunit ChlD